MISGISSRKQMASLQNLNFLPTSITGCQLWLDGTDPATITMSGASVTAWRDKSVSGLNLNQAKNTFPAIGTAINGLNTVSFTSTAGLGQNTILDGVKNFYWVARFGTNPDFIYLMGANSTIDWTGTTTTFIDNAFSASGLRSASPATLYANNSNTTSSFSGLSTPAVGTTFLLSVVGITGSTRFQGICYDRTIGRGYRGDVGEVLCYMTALTTAQHQQVEGYLAWKWGLQSSLPTSHPYRFIAPNSQGLAYPSALSIPVPTQSFSRSSSPLALFNPNSISGLTLWLDATTGVNANVWSDKSSSQNNVTRTGGTITTTTVNNVQAFSFTGVGMSYNNNLIFNGTTGSTCFFISAPSATTNNHLLSTSLGASSHFLFADGNLYEAIGFSSRQTISGLSFNTVQMYGNIANRSGNTLIFRNGTQIFSATYGSGYTPLTYSVAGWTGTVCEILVYTRTLLLGEQQQVEGYLSWKWGLQTSLPSNHPFRNILPGPYGIPITNISLQPASFRPTQFTGLLVWTDASTLGLANNATLLFWPNGGSQGTVNCTGTFLTNQLNGLPIVRLNTTQTWSIASQPSPSAYSLFFVTRQRGGTNERVLQATSGNSVYGYVGGRKNVLFIDGNPGFLTGSPSDTAWDLFSHTRTQNSAYTFNWNGTSSYSGASSANGPLTGLAINTGSFAAQASDCDVAEIILYNSVLSTQQVQQLEGYFAWKWGLQGNLPANHPFKRFLPPPS